MEERLAAMIDAIGVVRAFHGCCPVDTREAFQRPMRLTMTRHLFL